MLKRIFLFLVTVMFIFGMSEISLAMMCGGDSGHGDHTPLAQSSGSGHAHEAMPEIKPSSEEAVNVGNKICPVSGEKIVDKLKATYEYNGKIYNFCCASCVGEFKKDPEKYIKKVEEELQVESKGQSQHEEHGMGSMQETGTSHQGTHQGHQH